MAKSSERSLPVLDFSVFRRNSSEAKEVATQLQAACREHGFFYVAGHGIDPNLQAELETYSHAFFALPLDEKREIRMERGGKAWRGYFELGMELTGGVPDRKEGIYFGQELSQSHLKVRDGTPLHGSNLFPVAVPLLADTVQRYLDEMTDLGHLLMEALSLSLDLPKHYFDDRYTQDPLVLFRIFHYPPSELTNSKHAAWGVGEHTDYGMLTILKQDDVGGLQIKSKKGWIDAPPIPNTFVCNIGDMLDLMTGGYYQSTPHRVLNLSGRSRYSYPFFFDPNWDAPMKPIRLQDQVLHEQQRWDGKNLHAFSGTYGEYLLSKVSRVFPQLFDQVQEK